MADPTVGRALYMANHVDDLQTDSYGQQDGVMTKFGFGRKGAGVYAVNAALTAINQGPVA